MKLPDPDSGKILEKLRINSYSSSQLGMTNENGISYSITTMYIVVLKLRHGHNVNAKHRR